MPPIRPQQYTARLEEKMVFNEKYTHYSFELEKPHRMPFLAGQYISLKVTESGERRSYSICSSPDIEHGFELLVDVSPNGLGSAYLENLEFGDQIEFLSPLGQFTVNQDGQEGALAFVATGSGIAPIRSMILDQLQVKQDERPMILYWGLRYVNQMFWENEFEQLEEAFPNFQFHPTISRAPEEWPLCHGRVTDCLSTHTLLENAGYYLCGNSAMIQDVSSLLLNTGVSETRIHHEKFY